MDVPGTSRRVRIRLLNYEPIRVTGLCEIFAQRDDCEVESVPLQNLLKGPEFDVLLLALRDLGLTCELIATLRLHRPHLRVLVMGPSSDEEAILSLIASGARGWLEQTASPEQIVQAIQVVLNGSIWAPRRVLSIFVDRVVDGRQLVAGPRAAFTSREQDVLRQLVMARSNREIAEALSIREQTVKSYIAKMMRKVGVDNRIALSMQAPEFKSGSDES